MPVKRKAAVAPFRIYSGWDSRQAEAAEVFAFSVHEHASIPVEIRFVSADPAVPGGPVCQRRGVTAFSFARFAVPSLCGYEGKAVYGDGCDQLCLADVAELAAIPMGGCAVKVVKHEFHGQARPRSWSSLVLMDCSRLTMWTPDVIESAPDDMLMRFGWLGDEEIGELPWEWNMMMQPGVVWDGQGAKMLHWSYLSMPDGGSWIDRSGSQIWMAAREQWRDGLAR